MVQGDPRRGVIQAFINQGQSIDNPDSKFQWSLSAKTNMWL